MDRATTQRLWGAAVLIAIAVIFLPMLVKGPAPDSGVRDVPLDIPKASEQPQSNIQELPLGEPGALPASGATGFDDTTATVDAQDVAPAAVAAGDYAINFGNYGSAGDAQKVIAALEKSGLRAYSDAVNAGNKPAFRVRIGPYASREAAEAARIDAARVNPSVKTEVVALNAVATESIKPASAPAASTPPVVAAVAESPKAKPVVAEVPKPAPAKTETVKPQVTKPAASETKTQTAVVEKPPVAKPVEKPAASSTGFAVQLGAFANPDEAQKLRDRARAAGFSATTESVKTDKGVLTRVKLGPTTTRQSADAMRASAQSKLGVAGVVRSQP
ncbi:SPOR domain-containing protein [Lysobacter soyae]|uniref:SPOR domain-containing protein n=1 Tax=Lysobacter soyae TaxID=2764185 RepID=A0ABX8WS62_9GAMM|nr:SPOR domain-containing protein [Lysobacter sp. CJ11]QYR53665.1 SPOR domain-containing protein [Lysobacter sp. CJ11]